MSKATENEVETKGEDKAEGEPEASGADKFGHSSSKTVAIGYGFLMGTVALALWGLLSAGKGLTAPEPEGGGVADERAHASADEIVWKLLLAAIVILVVCRLVGGLLRKIHQPHVIGEIIAGILLGPSLLGAVWPSASAFLFPTEILPFLDLLAQLGLIFYMFLVGLELDFNLIKGRGHAAVYVSHASIIAPFLMGVALSLWLYPTLGSGSKFSAFALFIGAAMSITAFPVLARILTDRGLYKTRLGTVALTVGAVDDVTAWCLLAVVITVARASGMLSAMVSIGLALLFIVFMLYLVRPLMHRVAMYYERRGQLSGTFLAMLFVGLLASALITDKLKIHVIFGAFLFGAIMPHHSGFIRDLSQKLEDFSVVFLLPLFFTFSGLRTDIFSIGSDPKLWLMTLLILVVAIAGKWGGSKLAARYVGLDWREAGALGVLVNCRGLTELIILNIGLQMGVLPPPAFAMLVLMAVITTLMTEPALTLYYPRAIQRRMIRDEKGDDGEDEPDDERRKILVAVGNTESAHELTRLAILVAGDHPDEAGEHTAAEVTLLRVVNISGTEVSHSSAVQQSMLDEAVDRLRPLRQMVEEAGIECNPIAIASGHVGETVARVANELEVHLVLMGHHEALFGHRLLGGKVGDGLRGAKADVAVFCDPPSAQSVDLGRPSRLLVPYGG
ncbi:MAG: cation:proton antiporter, partial [Acidimicrobiales bacterium]